MRFRAVIFAVIAIVIAFGTAQLARNWLAGQRAELEAQKKVEKPSTFILVASRDLPTGSFVRPEDMTWTAWPEGQTSDSYMHKGKDSEQTLVGSVVRSRIAAGEPMSASRVVKPGDRGFLAAVLSPGMRAVSVSVTATSGIAGLVFPGDRVDLVLSHAIKYENDQSTAGPRYASETVVHDLRVLAIDQTTDDQNGKPVLAKNVTFEVTPKQVEMIGVANNLGQLSLSLRSLGHPGETDMADGAAVTTFTWDSDVSKLLPPPPRPGAKKKAEDEGPKLTVLRGDSEENVAASTQQKGAATGTVGGDNNGSAGNNAAKTGVSQ
jgi:pilus assembly protein CpaB